MGLRKCSGQSMKCKARLETAADRVVSNGVFTRWSKREANM